MGTVLLTRPHKASESLAEELRKNGYEAVAEPLLVIEPLRTAQPHRARWDALMITSGNALDVGQDFSALYDVPCFCVGSRTAAKARGAGFREVHHSASDGIEVAQLIHRVLGSEATAQARAILHMAGRDIDSKAKNELTRLGHHVTIWPVYAAQPVSTMTESTLRFFKQTEIDVVMIFSVRTAETLNKLLSQHNLISCCENMAAIGLSEAVAEALKPMPWKKLAVAPIPSEDAMIECLKQIFPAP